ncbi:MAG TPA: zinc ribbon domain-containing protein [Pyrinomonadaceae bacterium]|nr:zinc ribbon domain-containing protein [Pyrinomonadaceae bacterium]
MENKCHKCGAPVAAGEPFCGRCGAVVGMRDAAPKPDQSSPDFAATVVGKQPTTKRRPTSPGITKERALPPEAAAPPRPRPEAPRAGGGSSARYAVIGFVAVLLVGGLLLLLLWFNSGG